MPLSESLLKILVCPESKAPVTLAPDSLVVDLNAKIDRAELKNRAGKPLTQKLSGALVRSDGKRAYPIIDDIPVMLVEEGIDLS